MAEPEELPDGARFTDVLEAVQAAWLAGHYPLARDLVQRYVDPNGEFCCMRCTAMHEEPWRVNGALGTFFVCAECAKIASRPGELLAGGGEVFMIGPTQKITKSYRQGLTRVVETTSAQTKITMHGEDKNGVAKGFLITAIGHAIKPGDAT